MMLLTTCAACAKPLEHDAPAHCVNCRTRYCSDRCLRYHAHRGGHDENCDEIASGGGAEQHHANKKYEEAAAEAVEECAEDTEGQTCYICLEDGADEGLVRMCACRGASGIAHLSCLARHAKILVQEAEERNLNTAAFNTRWRLWDTCGLCKQDYHGVVACALGWACWKTYLGRPERDSNRQLAMSVLGGGLSEARHHEDALSVYEAELAMERRLGASEKRLFAVQTNLASTYMVLGRKKEAHKIFRDVYSRSFDLVGQDNERTLIAASNYADALVRLKRFENSRADTSAQPYVEYAPTRPSRVALIRHVDGVDAGA